jgi:DNA-binding transcriptional ArsR family regulator
MTDVFRSLPWTSEQRCAYVTVPRELLKEVARRFGYLRGATRLKVLSELHDAGEASDGQPAELSGVPLAGVSHHLNRLADGGIVSRRRRGTSVIYWVSDPAVAEFCELVCAPLRGDAGATAR